MPSPFRPARELLIQYAHDHRDRRNIATHSIGIPMIVFAISVLLARPTLDVETPAGALALTPAVLLWAASTLWYLTRGEFWLGLAVSVLNGALVLLAAPLASGHGIAAWLAWALSFFLLGWVIQFFGHVYEGRRPAFTHDFVGLLVGPQFVTAEALFSFGLLRSLRDEIERRAGPTRIRDLALPA